MIVSDIEGNCLLGEDIFRNSQNGWREPLLSDDIIERQGHEITCRQVDKYECVRK